MARYLYVDNSNVFIEGQRVAAVENGNALDMGDAMRRRVFDHDYRLDFGKLYQFISKNGDQSIGRAMLFGPRPPPNDSLWKIAESAGFDLVIEDRDPSNREKKIDTGIVMAMSKDAFKKADASKDKFVLVAGDGDYVPAVMGLLDEGFTVEVVFWGHASRELQRICSQFIEMDAHLAALAL